MKTKLKFNIPKDKEDKRRLIIDLEEQVGVLEKEENGKFIVIEYKKESDNIDYITDRIEELKRRRKQIEFEKKLEKKEHTRKKMLSLKKDGLTYQQIGDIIGITRQGVWNILNK